MNEQTAPIIAVTNQKGGVGKTTLSINVASALVEAGARVLLVDMDPQANSTSGLGVDPADGPTIADVLFNTADAASAIRTTALDGLHLVPASPSLRGADVQLTQQIGAEQLLRDALSSVPSYDYIFIDCPPALDRLTLNALAAATHVLVPVQLSGKWPLEGTGQLLETVDLVRSRLNPTLSVLGVVPTFYTSGTELADVLLAKLTDQFGELLFSTRLNTTPSIGEASLAEAPIIVYAKESEAAENFRELARELERRLSGALEAEPENSAPADPLPNSL